MRHTTTTLAHLLAAATVAGLALAGPAALAGPLPTAAAAASELTVETTPDDPIGPGDGPDDEPEDEPGAGPASGIDDVTSCHGQGPEGQRVDLCDHPDPEPTPETTDPCEEQSDERELTTLTIPAAPGGGGPLDLTAEVAPCETPGDGGDGGAPFTG